MPREVYRYGGPAVRFPDEGYDDALASGEPLSTSLSTPPRRLQPDSAILVHGSDRNRGGLPYSWRQPAGVRLLLELPRLVLVCRIHRPRARGRLPPEGRRPLRAQLDERPSGRVQLPGRLRMGAEPGRESGLAVQPLGVLQPRLGRGRMQRRCAAAAGCATLAGYLMSTLVSVWRNAEFSFHWDATLGGGDGLCRSWSGWNSESCASHGAGWEFFPGIRAERGRMHTEDVCTAGMCDIDPNLGPERCAQLKRCTKDCPTCERPWNGGSGSACMNTTAGQDDCRCARGWPLVCVRAPGRH